MDWWILLGHVLAAIFLAVMVEEYFEYPDWLGWLEDVPALRWTANLVIGSAAGVVVLLAFGVTYFAIQITVSIALVIGGVLGIVWLIVRLSDRFSESSASDGREIE